MPPLPDARFKERPEDFVVDELPAYEPSGAGQHLYVTFRKTNLTTDQAVSGIARWLDVSPRDAGVAGQKDKRAVTTQTASFLCASDPDLKAGQEALPAGIELLHATRHINKLKPGHLKGNRFTIQLGGLTEAAAEQITRGLAEIAAVGLPNAFGPQRFGRDGDNPEVALAWLRGDGRPPRDRRAQRFLFSAFQSQVFNDVLAAREADGTWNQIRLGDLAKRTDSGGLFLVDAEVEADAKARCAERQLVPTGPMFGAGMKPAAGEVATLEQAALSRYLPDASALETFRHLGEGTRRALVLFVDALSVKKRGDNPAECGLEVAFVLPKGGYATSVLGRVCVLHEPPPPPRAASRDPIPFDPVEE